MAGRTLIERLKLHDAKRVAIIESTHWHVPLYLPALESDNIRIVAVSDSVGLTGAGLAKRFGCPAYTNAETLLAAQKIDFAFVFGRHCDMPALARSLIHRGLPFALEKPCGIRSADVRALAEEAEAAGVYVAVPFVQRQSEIVSLLREAHAGHDHKLDHASFRFIGGPPRRYTAAGNSWMLDAALAGGGPLINLGIHFVDLFAELAGEPIETVSAASMSHIHELSIEDVVSLRLITASGRMATIECGYTFPSNSRIQREFTFSLRSNGAYLLSHPDGVFVRTTTNGVTNPGKVVPAMLEADLYYQDFATRVLADAFSGVRSLAGLRDAERALRIVEAAYLSAARGGVPEKVMPDDGSLVQKANNSNRNEPHAVR
jgi:predicted dehydrogenase